MKNEDNIYSRDFLKQNWEQLIEIGFPIEIIESEKKWGYFIDHLNYPELPFRLENLSIESLTKLYQLIVDSEEFGIMSLKEQLKRLANK